jgi:integrase/DNA-binding MarR family transcriptional regulator
MHLEPTGAPTTGAVHSPAAPPNAGPSEADAFNRARQVLAAAAAAGAPIRDRTGRQPSPITLPEYRLGRAPANKGKRYPAEILNAGEMQAFLDAFDDGTTGVRNRALAVMLWRAGLRIAEALALMPKDVDLENGVITVLSGKGAKRRAAGIDQTAVLFLREWEAVRAKLAIGVDAPLFCTFTRGSAGRPIGSSSVREAFKRAAQRAGIQKRVHPHGLRHTHAFDLATEGVPVPLIQKQLGHASLVMTEHYIDHLAPVQLLTAVRAREWPGRVIAPATTRGAASQSVRVPLQEDVIVAAQTPRIPASPAARPLVKRPHPTGSPRGVDGEAKTKIMELIKANGGQATQAQLARALRVRNNTAKRHCEQLADAGQLVRRRMARPQGVGGSPLVVWALPPLKAIYRLDPRVEFGSRARNGHGPERVLSTIRALDGRASQTQIAGMLGLTPGTVGRHCQVLEARGELVRGGLDKATARRGSQVWSLPPRESFSRPVGLRLGLGAGSSSTTSSPKRSAPATR